jgi:hypothetical protein
MGSTAVKRIEILMQAAAIRVPMNTIFMSLEFL